MMLLLNGERISEGEYVVRFYYDEAIGPVFEVDLLNSANSEQALEAREDPVTKPSASGLHTPLPSSGGRFKVPADVLEQLSSQSLLRNPRQGKLNRSYPFGTVPLKQTTETLTSGVYNIQHDDSLGEAVIEIIERETALQKDLEVVAVGVVEDLVFTLQEDPDLFALEERLTVLRE